MGVYTLLFATLTGKENLLYLRYKLLVEDPNVEGGNFVLKKASCTCLGFGFLQQIGCSFMTTSYQVCKFHCLSYFFNNFITKLCEICIMDIDIECKAR